MAGHKKGEPGYEEQKARWYASMTDKYGDLEEYMRKIGSIGGRKGAADGTIKGFALHPELAKIAGAKAGKISKRGHTFIRTEGQYNVYIANDTGEVVKYLKVLLDA